MKIINILRFGFSFIVLFMLVSIAVLAQDKVEKEERIREKEVPKIAQEWLYDSFEKIKRPKWYKEFSDSGYSFEAKFQYDDHFHSVEFDSLGNILDVEIEIDWSELKEEVRSSIGNYFGEKFKEHKLIKIQIQYSGEEEDLKEFFDEDENEGILTQYEIEFSGIDLSGDSRIWEGTFDSQGNFLAQRIVRVLEMANVIF
ncbi:MAG: hypothetical protein P8O16_08995 [Algoriphagus sp.]|uniref:hypothetical protein n=1 Tax=Algoriphagus sp. TaxID=1872435 RepID=UPI0026130975|nr:hypothetical protein [Algoriphagus sp.]MDG1277404.1 hypothetical protein [Algoriphagus sp.]